MLVGYTRASACGSLTGRLIAQLKSVGCERVFVEPAAGATREARELNAALDYMRAGDVLTVPCLSCLACSTRRLVKTVAPLESRGIGFRALREGIDTAADADGLLFRVFAALADFEQDVVRERTAVGLASARAKGRHGGRPRALGRQDLNAARAMLRDPTLKVRQVARRLGVSCSTLYRYLPGGRAALEEKN